MQPIVIIRRIFFIILPKLFELNRYLLLDNKEKTKCLNTMKQIKFKSGNEIEIEDYELSGYTGLTELLTMPSINDKTTLLRAIRSKLNEAKAIKYAAEKLKQLNISNVNVSSNYFDSIDSNAVSGSSENIAIEFKYRRFNHDKYNTFLIDAYKCRQLYDYSRNNHIRTFIVNVYSDGVVCLFEFSKLYRQYKGVQEGNFPKSSYSGEKVQKKVIKYALNDAILIN